MRLPRKFRLPKSVLSGAQTYRRGKIRDAEQNPWRVQFEDEQGWGPVAWELLRILNGKPISISWSPDDTLSWTSARTTIEGAANLVELRSLVKKHEVCYLPIAHLYFLPTHIEEALLLAFCIEQDGNAEIGSIIVGSMLGYNDTDIAAFIRVKLYNDISIDTYLKNDYPGAKRKALELMNSVRSSREFEQFVEITARTIVHAHSVWCPIRYYNHKRGKCKVGWRTVNTIADLSC